MAEARHRGGPGAWWAHRSLRARLTAAATLVLALGLALAAAGLVWRLHATLYTGLTDTARQRALDVVAQLEHGAVTGPLLPAAADIGALVQVVDPAGRVVTRSVNLGPGPALFSFPAPPPGADPAIHAATGVAIDGADNGPNTGPGPTDPAPSDPGPDAAASYRVAVAAARTPTATLRIYVAVPTTEATQTLTDLVTALTVGGPALLAALAALGWVLVGRALRPVEVLRAQTAAISATDLHRRVSLSAARDEIGRLGATLNALLARLEAATEQHRRFVADAAHELRSPLAALRVQTEVALAHPEQADWVAHAPDLLDDLDRLTRLVDELVALARLDAAPARPRREPVDLDDIVLAEIRRARAGASVTIDARGVHAAQLVADPNGLEHIVANLLDNAVRHTTATVTVTLDAAPEGEVELCVADDGPGIPPADRTRVFERFTRLDSARSRDTGGAGLGLAIVAEHIRAHHGRVWIEDNHPGARVRLRLPRCGSQSGRWQVPDQRLGAAPACHCVQLSDQSP